MHTQWFSFSYPLERPYPFRWFTWVAPFGGLIAAVFLSFVSIATQGYETVAVYTSDPNVTEANQGLFAKWPDFLKAKTLPVCSPTSMPVNTHFFTNNTALTYTLRASHITATAGGHRPLLPRSLTRTICFNAAGSRPSSSSSKASNATRCRSRDRNGAASPRPTLTAPSTRQPAPRR